jgi:hypothetical protein
MHNSLVIRTAAAFIVLCAAMLGLLCSEYYAQGMEMHSGLCIAGLVVCLWAITDLLDF